MGYYTDFCLTIYELKNKKILSELDEAEPIIKVLRDSCESAKYALDEYGYYGEQAKWYNSDEDMQEFSRKYPHLVFKMYGIGEESEDRWETYYLNGKIQHCPCQFVYDEFDPEKLE